MKLILGTLVLVIFIFPGALWAKDTVVINRKTQSVDFSESTVDGQSKHPDGAYLVQKRSVDFIPLYRVREHFDDNIRASIDYLK